MVTNLRWRSIVAHLSLWLIAAASVAYFGHHAYTGAHGLLARRMYESEIESLKAELQVARKDRKAIEHRLELLDDATLDPDLLEEQARARLGWLNPRDRILVLTPDGKLPVSLRRP